MATYPLWYPAVLWGARLSALLLLVLCIMAWRGVVRVTGTSKTAKCPTCGREGPARGLRLHMALAHGKPDERDEDDEPCPQSEDQEHDYVELDPFDPRQAKALRAGWEEVCRNCGRLYRGSDG